MSNIRHFAGRAFSPDERLHWLIVRMYVRWSEKPNLVDRVRWNRWLEKMEHHV